MASTCWGSIRGKVLRATKVNSCGAVVTGAGNTLVTDGFVSVAVDPEIDEGEEINVKNANGVACINEPGCPEYKWLNVEITLCKVNPDLVTLATGNPLVLDAAMNHVGFRLRRTIQCKAGMGLELWSDVAGAACVGGAVPYGYFLLPWVSQLRLGSLTVENAAASFTLSGKAIYGSAWGVGPYDVDLDATPEPGPLLTAIGADDLLDIHQTLVPPPAAACAAGTLAA